MARKCVRFKRTKHGRRCVDYKGYVEVPGLGAMEMPKLLDQSVNSTDILVGAGAGGGLGLVVSGLIHKYWPKDESGVRKVPEMLEKALPVVSSLVAGAALYAIQQKSNPRRAEGHLIGSVAAGAATAVANFVSPSIKKWEWMQKVDGYNGILIDEPSRYAGILVDEPSRYQNYSGILVDEPRPALASYADNPALSDLVAATMNDDEDFSAFEQLSRM